MAHYKCNYIHPAMGRVLYFEDIFADSDEEAMKEAQARAVERSTELWKGDRKVGFCEASNPEAGGGH